jgi:hypothetical protein
MPTDTFSIAAAADDGSGWKEAATWAGVPGATFVDGSAGFDDTILGLQKQLIAGPMYRVNLAFLRFDTSTLPDDATVTAADLLLYVESFIANEATLFAADYYDFGGEPPVDADWELSSSGDCIASFDLASGVATSVNTIPLTGFSGISVSGMTGIRIAPANSVAPTVQNYWLVASQEHAQQEPRLSVTYTTTPAEAGPKVIVLQANRQSW